MYLPTAGNLLAVICVFVMYIFIYLKMNIISFLLQTNFAYFTYTISFVEEQSQNKEVKILFTNAMKVSKNFNYSVQKFQIMD